MARKPAPRDFWDYWLGLGHLTSIGVTVALLMPLALAYRFMGMR